MRTSFTSSLQIGLLGCLILTCSTQAQNLLVNGGFESGFSGWNGTYGLYSGTINPAPLSGRTVGELDGGQNPMYQSFATIPGVTYELKYGRRLPELDGNGIPIVGESTYGPAMLYTTLNGALTQEFISNRTAWNFLTLDFVATGTSSTVSFSVPK